MDNSVLKKLQEVESDILFEFDKFCSDHNLTYSLYAGTALGAVRHQGFIPWDDDIDVCMLRADYDKFIALWEEEHVKGYYLQNPADESCTINHAKIRKNNTILASKEELKLPGHHGIWIDVFAIDKIPTNKIKRKLFFIISKIRLVYTRGYTFDNGGLFLKAVSFLMLLIPRKCQIAIRKKCDKYVARYCDVTENFELIGLSSPAELGVIYPAEAMDRTHGVKFENYVFQLSDMYEEMLRRKFGNYMQFPSEEERICRHNPEVIEF